MFGESVSRITSPSSKVWDASLSRDYGPGVAVEAKSGYRAVLDSQGKDQPVVEPHDEVEHAAHGVTMRDDGDCLAALSPRLQAGLNRISSSSQFENRRSTNLADSPSPGWNHFPLPAADRVTSGVHTSDIGRPRQAGICRSMMASTLSNSLSGCPMPRSIPLGGLYRPHHRRRVDAVEHDALVRQPPAHRLSLLVTAFRHGRVEVCACGQAGRGVRLRLAVPDEVEVEFGVIEDQLFVALSWVFQVIMRRAVANQVSSGSVKRG